MTPSYGQLHELLTDISDYNFTGPFEFSEDPTNFANCSLYSNETPKASFDLEATGSSTALSGNTQAEPSPVRFLQPVDWLCLNETELANFPCPETSSQPCASPWLNQMKITNCKWNERTATSRLIEISDAPDMVVAKPR